MKTAAFLLCLLPLTTSAADSAFLACLQADTQTEALDPLRAKTILAGDTRTAPFAMLTDETKPTDAEKEAIAKWADIRTRCFKHDVPYRQAIPPEVAALIEATANGTIGLAASLYSGELTYGQFNKERSERSQKLVTALSAIRQREISRADAEDRLATMPRCNTYSISRAPRHSSRHGPIRSRSTRP